MDQINGIGNVEQYIVFKTSGSIKERTQTSTEMGTGCQQKGTGWRPIICQVVACAANQGVVVCGGAVCRKGLLIN